MDLIGILVYLLQVFAVLAFLNAVFRIARALESIAKSLETREGDQTV